MHMPAKPDQFEFDSAVSSIFPAMARRSIPNYDAFHALHAAVAANHFLNGSRNRRLLDVGASHGAFYTALNTHYIEGGGFPPRMQLIAIDNSPDMCQHMRTMLPDVEIRCEDADSPDFGQGESASYDVINCTFVIQFLKPERQMALLGKLHRLLKPGGLLILGQKNYADGALGRMMQEQYERWRMGNGYTREEIEAKTRALKGAMWPMRQEDLMSFLNRNFTEVHETTRMFMFSTLVAIK